MGGKGTRKRILFGWLTLSCLLGACSLPTRPMPMQTPGVSPLPVVGEASATGVPPPETSLTASTSAIPTQSLTPQPDSPTATLEISPHTLYSLQVQFDYARH